MRRVVILLSLLVLTAACGGATSQSGPSAPAAPSAPTSSEGAGRSDVPASGVPERLAFTADLLGGGQIEGGDLAGGDVVLWFWAPW